MLGIGGCRRTSAARGSRRRGRWLFSRSAGGVAPAARSRWPVAAAGPARRRRRPPAEPAAAALPPRQRRRSPRDRRHGRWRRPGAPVLYLLRPAVRADVPDLRLERHWLGYSRYDGIIVTAEDLAELARAATTTRPSCRRCGSTPRPAASLVVLGPGQGRRCPPRGGRGLTRSGTACDVYPAGFGRCIVTPDRDLGEVDVRPLGAARRTPGRRTAASRSAAAARMLRPEHAPCRWSTTWACRCAACSS